jgi:hypothetical protein
MLAKGAIRNRGNDWLPQLWRTNIPSKSPRVFQQTEELLESEEDEQPADVSVSGEGEEGTGGAKVVGSTNHVEN